MIDPGTAMIAAAGANLAGNMYQTHVNKGISSDQQSLQKKFAKKGIQWKVKDAQAAGISPLVALGAQTHQYQPFSVGGNEFSKMGQNMSDIIMQATDSKDRKDINRLQIEHQEIVNEMARVELGRMKEKGPKDLVDNVFMEGQPDSALGIKEKPLERTISGKIDKDVVLGTIPSKQFVRIGQGGVAVNVSKEYKELIEDLPQEQLKHFWRSIWEDIPRPNPKEYPLPKGKKWKFNYLKWAWFPVDIEEKKENKEIPNLRPFY